MLHMLQSLLSRPLLGAVACCGVAVAGAWLGAVRVAETDSVFSVVELVSQHRIELGRELEVTLEILAKRKFKVLEVKSDCTCTAARVDDSHLEIGENTKLHVRWKPSARRGMQRTTVGVVVFCDQLGVRFCPVEIAAEVF